MPASNKTVHPSQKPVQSEGDGVDLPGGGKTKGWSMEEFKKKKAIQQQEQVVKDKERKEQLQRESEEYDRTKPWSQKVGSWLNKYISY